MLGLNFPKTTRNRVFPGVHEAVRSHGHTGTGPGPRGGGCKVWLAPTLCCALPLAFASLARWHLSRTLLSLNSSAMILFGFWPELLLLKWMFGPR